MSATDDRSPLRPYAPHLEENISNNRLRAERSRTHLGTPVTDDADTEIPDAASSDHDDTKQREPRPLRLDQFLKLCGIAETGGHAKVLIQGGEVLVNGEVETRRRKQLALGDVIEVFDTVLRVEDFFAEG